jgi:hypothetical protein
MPDKLKQSIVLTANDAVVYESRDDDLDRFIRGTYGGKRRNNRRKEKCKEWWTKPKQENV